MSIDKLTFEEQRKLKRLTGGMSLQKIADGLDEMDADAWYGVVLLSIQKLNPRFVEATLGEMNMVDLLGAMSEDDEAEEEAADPPTIVTAAPSPDLSLISSGSEATPETPGTPTSPESSE